MSTQFRSIRRPLFTLSLCALSLLLIGGCQSTGIDQAQATSKDMTKVRSDMVDLKALVNQSAANLDSLVNKPQPELKPQYQAFSGTVSQMDKLSEKVRNRAADMRTKRDEYLTQWRLQTATMQNKQLKEISQERIAELNKEFDEMTEQGTKARKVFDPYLAEMKDINQYLSSDLTQGGLKAIKDVADKTIKSKAGVVEEFNALIKSLDEVAEKLKATGPPPPPATTN